MKRSVMFIMVVLVTLPAIAGTMYEWRDPTTGKLMLGDKPPSGGVQYWIEGQQRPEEKAAEDKRQAELKIQQEKHDAAEKVEQEKRILEVVKETEKRRKKLEKIREEKCNYKNDFTGVYIGMNQETFQLCFSVQPEKINITKTAFGTREQWVYHDRYYYFTNGILTAIQILGR